MGSQQTIQPTTGLIAVPLNYPTTPTPGKLEILIQSNDHAIYHRYSPYTEGVQFLGFGSKQPYIYDYIDKAKSGLSGLRRYESRAFPLGSAPRDVIRVSKFLTSGNGILFLGKQFLLQTFNSFNETRIYNPTSPIVAAGMGLGLGLIGRPQRNFDTSGGLLGIARTLIGNSLPDLFGGQNINPPSGTLGGTLPTTGIGKDGKGLLRAQTANRGKGMLDARWSGASKSGLGGFFKNLIKSVFGNFIPANQSPAKFRSDEYAYGLMIGNSGVKLAYFGSSGVQYYLGQTWIAGANIIRRNSERPSYSYKLLVNPDGTTYEPKVTSGGIQEQINLGANTVNIGYTVAPSTIESKPGIRYGDSIGAEKNPDHMGSEILLQYKKYTDPANNYKTKFTDQKSVEKTNENLQKVLNNFGFFGVYRANPNINSRAMSSPYSPINGYDKILNATNGQPGLRANNYKNSTINSYVYQNVRVVDNLVTNGTNKSVGLPGAMNADSINVLKIIPGEKSDGIPRSTDKPNGKSGMQYNKWNPYKDDLIAFYFYDVVNDKYIPFRATVQGINESAVANWEDMSFIGRADKLYSYGGFSRNLTFSFDVHINSIIELAPTWKRINYLMSLVKPARYTKFSGEEEKMYNKFMVPPMVLLTIGDMYKVQPIVLNNVSILIPDDASWEILNQSNSDEWSHLVDYIQLSDVGRDKRNNGEYGQFPRTAKLTVNCSLLEKERAIVGAAHFGHAPHKDTYGVFDTNDYPYMHQALVEYQLDSNVPLYPDKKRAIQDPTPDSTPAPITSFQPKPPTPLKSEPTRPLLIKGVNVGTRTF